MAYSKMHNFKLKIPKTEVKNDLKIIYKEGENSMHELNVPKDEVINTLRYFQTKSVEINQTKMIYIEENINFDIFKSFILSIHSKEIDINEENYQAYCYLSQKYGYYELYEQIKEFVSTRPDIFLIFTNLSNQTDIVKKSIDPQKEEFISKNIDFSIKSGLLSKLPLENIIRILNSPNRIVKDHHSLFQFVIELMKSKSSKDDEDKLMILPSCLDYCEMTTEEIELLFSISKSDTFFNPSHSKEKIKELISNENDLKNKFNELSRSIKEIQQSVIDAQKETNSQIFERLEKVEKQLVTTTSKFTLIDGQIQQQKTKIAENEQSFININKRIDDDKTQIKEIQQSVINTQKETNSQIFERLEKVEKQLITTTSKFTLIDDQIQQQKTKIAKNELSFINIKKRIDDEKTQNRIKEIQYELNGIECPNGIFKYLFDKYHANPINNGVIELTGNFCYNKEKIKNLIDSKWNKCLGSNSVENSFIEINFKTFIVQIKKYRIHIGNTSNEGYFKSWILKGITKDNKVVVLDDVNDCPRITSNNLTITKEIQNMEYFISFKLIMKGKNSYGNYCMVVRNIELFGVIKEIT